MSVNSTNPSTYYGGTWVLWGAGRVPVCINTSDTDFNTVEKTGGEKTHKLTQQESGLREHTHELPLSASSGTSTYTDVPFRAIRGGQTDDKFRTGLVTSNSNAANGYYGTPKVSGTSDANAINAHNNLQPYITCYMWKRTK